MNTTDQTIQVTLLLSKEIYQRAAKAAANEQQQIEDLLSLLIVEGLDAHTSVRQILESVSERYRDRLSREDKLNQSPSQVLESLSDVREQIANDLYS